MNMSTPRNRIVTAAALSLLCGSALGQATSAQAAEPQPAASPSSNRASWLATTPTTAPTAGNQVSTTERQVYTLPGGGFVSLGLQGNSIALLLNGKPFPADCVETRDDSIIYSWPKGNPVAALNISGGSVTPVIYNSTADQAASTGPRLIVGITISPLSAEVAEHLQIHPEEVIYVSSLTAGYGADEAGMKARDIITSVDGRKPVSQEILREILDTKEAGDTVRLGVLRSGGSKTFDVKVREWGNEDADNALTQAVIAADDASHLANLISRRYQTDQLALERARLAEFFTQQRTLAESTVPDPVAQREAEERAKVVKSVQDEFASRQLAELSARMAVAARDHALADQQQRSVVLSPSAPDAPTPSRLILPPEAVAGGNTEQWLRLLANSQQLNAESSDYRKALEALTSRLEATNAQRVNVEQAAASLDKKIEELSARLERLESLLANINAKLGR